MAQERFIQTTIPLPMAEIRAFCQQWKIIEFALFGSVLREDFNQASDIDVLVVFQKDAHPTLLDLVSMEEALEAIFGRKVDLITRNEIETSPNYIRRKAILDSAQVIYAAG
jgi:predicted nucleotidyltransferase